MASTPIWPTAGAPITGQPPTSNLTDQINAYVQTLIFQYANKPKAQGLIAILADQALMNDLATQLASAFVLSQAIGPQLDILGKYIGVNRNVGVNVTPPFFSLWDTTSSRTVSLYKGTWNPTTDTPTLPAASGGNNGWWYVASASGNSTSPISATWVAGDVIFSNGTVWARDTTDCGNGLTDTTDSTINIPGVFWSTAQNFTQYTSLTDPSYYALLKIKIVGNSMDGTLVGLCKSLNYFFPNQAITVTDNQNMTISYTVQSALVPLSLSVLETYLPHPMGVSISVTLT